MAGAGLLAQVAVAKYAGHMPLYRQAGIYRRAGIELERATLASWVREAAALLQPLSDALGGYVRAVDKNHTDDTPVPVLEPGRGGTRTARLWTYVRDDRPAGSRAPPAVCTGTHPTAKVSDLGNICRVIRESCRQMPSAVMTRCIVTVRSSRPGAGRMRGASFTTCTSWTAHRLPKKHCAALGRCMLLNATFAARRQTYACLRVNSARPHCSTS
jgi:hypothetical protein